MRRVLPRVFLAIAFLAFVAAHTVFSNEVVGPLVGAVKATTAKILFRPSAAATKLRLTVIDAKNISVRSVDALTFERLDDISRFQRIQQDALVRWLEPEG